MKKNTWILLFFGLIANSLFAQNGRIVTETFKSEILKRDMTCSIYLPPSYETSSRAYPMLYLLHGMGDDHTAWVNRGEVSRIATESIQKGESPEMLIIMPDGLVDAFYLNNFDKSILWEDFFYKEFIPAIEKKYRVISKRTYRAIAGLSMGGYGSLYYALKHKEYFSSCYAMSGAFLEVTPVAKGEKPVGMFENVNVKLWGPRNETGIHQNFKAHSLTEIVKNMPEYTPPTSWVEMDKDLPRIMLDCGDDDFLVKNNTNLFHQMRDKKIPVEFRVHDGSHNWTYWRRSLTDALQYAGKYFRD
jgi:S-formylglutathione hydrolase FrmB